MRAFVGCSSKTFNVQFLFTYACVKLNQMQQIRAQTPAEGFYTLDPFLLVNPNEPWYCDLSQYFDAQHYPVLRRLDKFFKPPASMRLSRFVHLGLVGHKGTGKSTLIRQATQDLQPDIVTTFVQSLSVFDQSDLTFSDVVLVIVKAIADYLEERKIQLPQPQYQLVLKWFTEELVTTNRSKEIFGDLTTQAEAGVKLPFVAAFIAKLTATIRSKSEYRTEIRERAERDSVELIRNANLFIDAATQELNAAGLGQTFLVVFDDLEKITNRALVDAAVLRRAEELRRLRCHIVFLLDPADQYAPVTVQASQAFDIVNVPNLRIRDRTDTLDFVRPEAIKAVFDVLDKRVDLEHVFADPQKAVEQFAAISGGRLRDLMILAKQACENATGNLVTQHDVDFAIRSVRSQRITAVQPEQWKRLAEIHRDKQISNQKDDAYLLLHSLVLNYNGEQWFDIHPLLEADPRFRQAWKTQSQPQP